MCSSAVADMFCIDSELLSPLPSAGGEGAADFSPRGNCPAEGHDRRGVFERGGGGERHLQSVQQPAGTGTIRM